MNLSENLTEEEREETAWGHLYLRLLQPASVDDGTYDDLQKRFRHGCHPFMWRCIRSQRATTTFRRRDWVIRSEDEACRLYYPTELSLQV